MSLSLLSDLQTCVMSTYEDGHVIVRCTLVGRSVGRSVGWLFYYHKQDCCEIAALILSKFEKNYKKANLLLQKTEIYNHL